MSRAVLALLLSTLPAMAQEVVTYDHSGSFADAAFDVEQAILNHGLVVNQVSHAGEMLDRTRESVGSDTTLFDAADIFTFCSAVVSRQVMEADPLNIAFCPYAIFVIDREDRVIVGYRTYPDGPLDAVETLLDGIARDATGR